MKRKTKTRKAPKTSRKTAALVLGACVAGVPVAPAFDNPEGLDYSKWFNLSGGAAIVSGDKARFQQRHQLPAGIFGGIQEFQFEEFLGDSILKIEGRSIFEGHDHLVRMELSKPDLGYFRAGFSEFRTWYDGAGGFFPPNQQWISLYDDRLHLDRGEVWAEVGLTLPDWPVLSFRYTHRYRQGQKDSTSWGETGLTGVPGATRGIVPSFRDIDERRHIFEGNARHTIGNTGLGLGLRYELSDQDNALQMRRSPGQPADRHITHREVIDTDIFNVHAFSDTRFTDQVRFTTGYSFTTLDTDIGDSRNPGLRYDDPTPFFHTRPWHVSRETAFGNMSGGSQLKQHVANLNLMLTPFEHLYITPSVRIERQDVDGAANWTEWYTGTAQPPTFRQQEVAASHDRGWTEVSQRLEARYTGIDNVALYARGDWLQGQGDLSEFRLVQPLVGGPGLIARETDDKRFHQKYTIGANWYPMRLVSFGSQYYHERRTVDYNHPVSTTAPVGGDRYPAFITEQRFITDNVNARVTLRPWNGLTLVSRYDFQLASIDTEKQLLAQAEAGERTRHMFGQNVSWSPITRLFLLGSLNYVIDRLESPANDFLINGLPLVPESRNDYWTASAGAGYALDEKTDLHANYYYLRADNYFDNSLVSTPYGADVKEHGITVSLMRRLTENLRVSAKYGFFTHRDGATGGNKNFDAHLVYSSLQYRF
jgi:hypothetical protein